ncbi:flagellar export chaperone FlgN [Pokkaliibacter sp. CJK22405]|uniref:flagellar export chaperone FlgN n=1 Tax=Pokkaliibacter sp. CJK22405 TaxID=3384615 RepID=UPI003985433F
MSQENLLTLVQNANQLLVQVIERTLEERELLKKRSLEGFTDCVDQKNELLQQLQANVTLRAEKLQQSGLGMDRKGHLSATPEDQIEAMTAALVEMDTLLKDFKQANDINSMIVGRSLTIARQTLDLAKGQQKNQQLYNNSGKAAHHAANQVIGKA